MKKSRYAISEFDLKRHDDGEIARTHLAIRHWQVETGQNTFVDIGGSQKDLSAIDKNYIKPGGNFFVAQDQHDKIIGFVGIANEGNGRGFLRRLAVLPDYQRRGIANL